MMVSGPHLAHEIEGEMYTDSELDEEEEFSDEVADEFGSDEVYVPKTFEDFQTLFNQQFVPAMEDEDEEEICEHQEVSPSEPKSVDKEMESRVEAAFMKKPESALAKERTPEPELSPDEGPMSDEGPLSDEGPDEGPLSDEMPLSQEDEYEPEEEPEELSGRIQFHSSGSTLSNIFSDEELIDEEEIDYEDEVDSEDLSDIDDDDLMKRLEAKYGKISGENSEDDDDPEAWTSNYD